VDTGSGDDALSDTESATALRRYLDDRDRPHPAEASAAVRVPIAPVVAKKALKHVVPESLRPTVTLAATDAIRPLAARRARRLARSPGTVLVQLGSGYSPKLGWINVDVVGKGADVAWNLHRRLPFEDSTVDVVFHEHVLEHFTLADGFALTRDVFRVLRPKGIVRIAVPDAERYVRSYATNGDELDRLRPGRPTKMLALQEVFLRHGHRAAYDFETLRLLLVAAGFTDVRLCDFAETSILPAPDSEHRRNESIYAEATKPAGAVGSASD
jgi:predicted SAM-dependent methyltransferase